MCAASAMVASLLLHLHSDMSVLHAKPAVAKLALLLPSLAVAVAVSAIAGGVVVAGVAVAAVVANAFNSMLV